MKYKIISVVILITFLLSAGYTGAYAEYTSFFYGEAEKDLFNSIKGKLPPATPPSINVGTNTVPFNFKLWFERNIVVYGDYTMCNFSPGDFMAHGDGFYERDGIKGEYRYHGFDSKGKPYPNGCFTCEEDTSSVNDIKWLYRPWDSKTHGLISISPFNLAAERNTEPHEIKTRAWLNRPLGKDEEILTFENGENPAIRDVSSYIHVVKPPTILCPGEGRGWYLYNDTVYYRSFTLDKLEHINKIMPEMVTTAEILTAPEGLKVIDYKLLNTAKYLNEEIEVDVRVKGLLLDEEYYGDEVLRTAYYTRDDIKDWDITLAGQSLTGLVSSDYNRGEGVFTLTFKRSMIIESKEVLLPCKSRVNFLNGECLEKTGYTNLVFNVEDRKMPYTEPLSSFIDGNKNVPLLIVPLVDIPSIAFDTEFFVPTDRTYMEPVLSRKVFLDGVPIDDEEFFSGDFLFGRGNTGMKKVDVFYEGANDDSVYTTKWVYVYSSEPKARFTLEGEYKQNRKLVLKEDCERVNILPVAETYPVTGYEWIFESLDQKGSAPCIRNLGDGYKEIMYKEPGRYRIGLIAENTEGIKSEPSYYDFIIAEDTPPVIEINIWNGVLTRIEFLDMHYNVVSADKDLVAEKSLKIFYDSNNDGIYDLMVKEFKDGVFDEFIPDRVGRYKIVAWAKESFGGETLEEFITREDYKERTVESEFLVDNLAPITSLYIDAPVNIPGVDLFIFLDEYLNTERTNGVKQKSVDITNAIRALSIDPYIYTWDAKSYTVSEEVETSSHFGKSYPEDSLYYSSSGYSGTLSLYDVSDNGCNVDKGKYENTTEYRYFYREHENSVHDYYETSGLINSSETSPAPATYFINEDGFLGYIPRTGTRTNSQISQKEPGSDEYLTSFSAIYEGVLSKIVKIWKPNMVWENDYTGFYRGTVYNSISQPLVHRYRGTADKYLLYISDTGINCPEIYNVIKSHADGKVILVGNDLIKEQSDYDLFISKDNTLDDILNEVVEYIGERSPKVEGHYVLAGIERFDIKTMNFDGEQDKIIREEFNYIHNPDYFDNPVETESYAGKDWIQYRADRFMNPGEFTISRRIKDKPCADEAFDEYSYYSGDARMKIYAHRRPIPVLDYKAKYNSTTKMFELEWICSSYDPDHEYSDPERGIRDRKMVLYTGSSPYYIIPEQLAKGNYYIEYYVRDMEGVWSDPLTMSFSLKEPATNSFVEAKIRPVGEGLVLSAFPASESIEIYDTKTDKDVKKLKISVDRGGKAISEEIVLNFDSKKDTLTGNTIYWRDTVVAVPENTTDGPCGIRVEGINDNGVSIFKEIPFTVNTPIDLNARLPNKVSPGIPFDIWAETSPYVYSVQIKLFEGTDGEITKGMVMGKKGDKKQWEETISILSSVTVDEGLASFTATTVSGKQEKVILPFDIGRKREVEVDIEGYWNHWRGQTDVFGTRMGVEPHRFLGLEKVLVTISIKGYGERVQIRFSPSLESRTYRDEKGNFYDMCKDFGLEQVLFPATLFLDPKSDEHRIQWEYVLPLADSTVGWNNKRNKPPYYMEVIVMGNGERTVYTIDDIDITGNITELTFIE